MTNLDGNATVIRYCSLLSVSHLSEKMVSFEGGDMEHYGGALFTSYSMSTFYET